jgi:hypothetical protein
VVFVGSLWSVLEEREAELSEQAASLREQLAAVEAKLARVVVSRETYQELMSVEQLVDPVVSGPSRCEVLDGRTDELGEVLQQTVKVFQAEREALDCRTVALRLGLAGTPAQLKTVRNRIARLAAAGILVRADRGRYQLAEAGALR